MDEYKVYRCLYKMDGVKLGDRFKLLYLWCKTAHITYEEFRAILQHITTDLKVEGYEEYLIAIEEDK